MRRTDALIPVAMAAIGLAAIAAVAALGALPAHDAVVLSAYAAGGAAGAGLLAWALLAALRGASVIAQAVVAGLAPVVAIAIGVAAASSAMFISDHDLHALFVILVGSGTVGIITAIVLGQRVAGAGRSLRDMARRLGDHGPGTPLTDGARAARGRAGSSELAHLADELEVTSARLAAAQQQAAALEHSRRELVAWVSHDLRTPLAGIRAMVEALEDGVVDDRETVARYHRTIRQEADRLAMLVDDLFELSRIQAGALRLELQRVLLADLVSDAVAGASVSAAAKHIELRGSTDAPSPLVELSTPEMARVVRNLLDNAIRHTPPGGTIVVQAGLDPSGGSAQVSVLDACGGIPEADLDRVFETAYRGDRARTPGDVGAGLGLAVARGLVEAHHGEITAHNEASGCRFTIRLPLPRPPGTGDPGDASGEVASATRPS